MSASPPAALEARAVPFAQDLGRFGDQPALITADGQVSYRELAARVDEVRDRLAGPRRLVLVEGANRVETIVGYLAALAADHPVLLVPGDSPRSIQATVAAYRPEVVVGTGGIRYEPAGAAPAYRLHPDLALLLTTSGSTGSAKLVRLSHRNLQANAEAIASYLDVRETDRAATTLPMHYCYGLSVVHTHLLRGAGLILTDRSVADDGFWELFREHAGTSFAGVPYTFDLLDRVGFDRIRLPHLRYLTQAGGALAPERVRRYAELGARAGWRLFVMYGQTEATARMAYLPPVLATIHPGSIGGPIPGGSFRLEPLPDWSEPDTGELVYAGPNVMLGYAERPADLELGRVVEELRTGDVARRTADGRYEIVGRRSRFAKVFGLRIDLSWVEAALARHGYLGCGAGGDGELVVAVEGGDAEPVAVRRLVARECGLPERVVRVHRVAALPRLPSGKPDYPAVLALAADPAPVSGGTDLVRLFGRVLGRPDVTGDSTFVSLGGDSLSYVEMSVQLERALGELPDQWHVTPIRDLASEPGRGRPADRPAGRRSRASALDTSVALRAIAIVLVVGTHASLFGISGGAHLLLGVAGFNFARFHLTGGSRGGRVRHLARSIARVAAASAVWIGLASLLLTDDYSVQNIVLLHQLFPDPGAAHGWHFWFVESLVYFQLAALGLLAIPLVDRLERRHPFALPLALVLAGLVTRYHLVPGDLPTPAVVAWLFALGWAAGKATGRWQRGLVTVALVATVPGFFGDPSREAVMVAGLVLLVWVDRLPSWRPLTRVAGVLAGSSLFIYLTHWQVYPHLTDVSPLLATAGALAAGIGYAAVVSRARAMLAGRWLPRRGGGSRAGLRESGG
ncbi:MAG: AMP-binding protein [Micromonosporaceae bacterium]|nr:AMP-binding protein [Micromonosporaceae bacterium]